MRVLGPQKRSGRIRPAERVNRSSTRKMQTTMQRQALGSARVAGAAAQPLRCAPLLARRAIIGRVAMAEVAVAEEDKPRTFARKPVSVWVARSAAGGR